MTGPDRLLGEAAGLLQDPICAVSTAPGRGAVGVVRLSGAADEVERIAAAVLPSAPLPARRAVLATLRDPRSGERIDRGLALLFPGPRSYTGEHVLELHLHGSPAVLEAALDALVAAGARAARPGEFTRRAVLAGKLSLLQAEGVDALIRAESREAVRVAGRALSGRLGDRLAGWADRLRTAAASLEAVVDFPEEVDPDELRARSVDLRGLGLEMEELAATYAAGRRLVDGTRVALVGPVNAGKSTLFNALLGRARAIVSERAGTTRDVVSENVLRDGLLFRFEDTAGLRRSEDPVEAEGIERSAEAAATADVVLAVRDGRDAAPETPGERELLVATHGDLLDEDRAEGLRQAGFVVVSGRTGRGVDGLWGALGRRARAGAAPGSPALHTARQHEALRRAADCVGEAVAVGEDEAVLAALSLRAAGRALEELVGDWSDEAVLDRVFETFCLGK